MFPLILVFCLFAWALFILSVWKRDYFVGFAAGALLLVIGVFGLIYGIQGVVNLMTNGFSYIHLFLGVYITVCSGYEFVERR